jgi:environmental stress-induced protein Ves
MRILRAADHRRMPWKNGGGITTEIAVFPDGAGLDAFQWRISMATVAADGPFSLFPGVDRTLSILEGGGIKLAVEGQPDVTLTPASPPHSFPADRPASAGLLSDPVCDLNVMTRRGLWRHRVERLADGERNLSGGPAVVFCATGPVTVADGRWSVLLGRHDAALMETGKVACPAGGSVLVAVLERLPMPLRWMTRYCG